VVSVDEGHFAAEPNRALDEHGAASARPRVHERLVPEPLAALRAGFQFSELNIYDVAGRTADRLGGTGQTHDWSVSARIVAAVTPVPVYLAGGCGRRTWRRAVARVRPAGWT